MFFLFKDIIFPKKKQLFNLFRYKLYWTRSGSQTPIVDRIVFNKIKVTYFSCSNKINLSLNNELVGVPAVARVSLKVIGRRLLDWSTGYKIIMSKKKMADVY